MHIDKYKIYSYGKSWNKGKESKTAEIQKMLTSEECIDGKQFLILLDNPMVLNKEIAEKSNMSIDGIGSSLRRMYDYFEITETKYKKVALIHKAANISEVK